MRHSWANPLLLLLPAAQAITGYLGSSNGIERRAWVLWLHGASAHGVYTNPTVRAFMPGPKGQRRLTPA